MSFIDWSDPEEMLGLLSEYVIDEYSESNEDAARSRFLGALSAEIEAIALRSSELSVRQAIDQLRIIRDSQPAEFCSDPALIHMADCIEELERISAAARLQE
ncbi:MAG: hypothetical protein ACRD3J_25340 [Thermoanaerobaculia bacterium]